jgi:hypothetical protein
MLVLQQLLHRKERASQGWIGKVSLRSGLSPSGTAKKQAKILQRTIMRQNLPD